MQALFILSSTMKFASTLFSLLLAISLSDGLPLALQERDLTSDTQNDLLNGTPCKNYTVIFARETTSAGNVGESTGPPFFQAIASLVGASNLAVQGVDYPATILGFLQVRQHSMNGCSLAMNG